MMTELEAEQKIAQQIGRMLKKYPHDKDLEEQLCQIAGVIYTDDESVQEAANRMGVRL